MRSTRRGRQGFSLVEVLVAMGMLSILMMGLARATFQMAAVSKANDTVAKRTAVLIQEANKYNAMPFAQVVSVPATVLTFGDFKFQRTVTVTQTTTTRYTVKIVIVPYVANVLTASKKDSVFLTRTNPPGSPLCTTCS
jgi:prepilin-type N-terminal cleavage/methylation domain-containing protein